MKTPVQVSAKPHMTRADEARAQLRLCSEELHVQAAQSLAEGLYLERQSARLEALAEGVDDEDATRVRDIFVKEGLLEVLPFTSSAGGEA